ncbi:DNA-directed RNA polymerase subunit omega [Candidatus Sneabacter namystus]|uniref:DNA-directed RNA polymerase subunit omega n=1 Tax=Candidatus Sneabacter namystus TaxID=2601646 RepID=A0A5C0UL20_9RICK|nr:DNA-directed RNA polymerase subunit omega [Candidatus Sneabacter namystus]QEK39554.1 DNA-directed RNA polymerase subunit omega [Candidatus Sneabacter namystus]
MARVTVEDCLKNKEIDNKFDLVLVAVYRARELESGEETELDDVVSSPTGSIGLVSNALVSKSHVVALKEIGKGLVNVAQIKAKMRQVSDNIDKARDDRTVLHEYCKDTLFNDDSNDDNSAFYVSSDLEGFSISSDDT